MSNKDEETRGRDWDLDFIDPHGDVVEEKTPTLNRFKPSTNLYTLQVNTKVVASSIKPGDIVRYIGGNIGWGIDRDTPCEVTNVCKDGTAAIKQGKSYFAVELEELELWGRRPSMYATDGVDLETTTFQETIVKPEFREKRCTCGTDVILGPTSSRQSHSDWCDKF